MKFGDFGIEECGGAEAFAFLGMAAAVATLTTEL